jgi:hypothetical protein
MFTGGKHASTTLTLLFAFTLASAADAHASSDLKKAQEEYDSVCGQIVKQSDSKKEPEAGSTLYYCLAAKGELEGAKNENIVWKIYAGVSGVCATACAVSATGYGLMAGQEYVCTGAAVAGAASEAIITKEYTQALTALAMTASPVLLNTMSSSTTKAAEGAAQTGKGAAKTGKGAVKTDVASCISAATSALTSFQRYKAGRDQTKSAVKNIQSAKDHQSETTQEVTETNNSELSNSSRTGQSTSGQAREGEGLAQDKDTPEVCKTAHKTQIYSDRIACAAATDSELPSFVNSQRFGEELGKNSGQDPNSFMDNFDSPKDAIMGSMLASMKPNQIAELSPLLDKMAEEAEPNNSSIYHGGGGGGFSGGGEDGEMAAVMGMLSQLMPKNPQGQDQHKGITAVISANKRNGPSTIAEDRSLSIFDRVSYRYFFVGRRILSPTQKVGQ